MEPFHPDQWQRRGRGRSLQFFAADEDMLGLFSRMPAEFGPYWVVGASLRKDGHTFRHEGFCRSLEEWCVALGRGATVTEPQFFVRAAAVSPEIPRGAGDIERTNEWATVNGFILVQHGDVRRGQRMESAIGIVDHIVHRKTGETCALDGPRGVYDRLLRAIRRRLKYNSIQVFRDGHSEDDPTCLMTERAADLARAGAFIRRPGAPVRG